MVIKKCDIDSQGTPKKEEQTLCSCTGQKSEYQTQLNFVYIRRCSIFASPAPIGSSALLGWVSNDSVVVPRNARKSSHLCWAVKSWAFSLKEERESEEREGE